MWYLYDLQTTAFGLLGVLASLEKWVQVRSHTAFKLVMCKCEGSHKRTLRLTINQSKGYCQTLRALLHVRNGS